MTPAAFHNAGHQRPRCALKLGRANKASCFAPMPDAIAVLIGDRDKSCLEGHARRLFGCSST
jgi:hypothetical protein